MSVRFGAGALGELRDLARGRRAVVLASEGIVRRGTLAAVESALDVTGRFTSIAPNPTLLACSQVAERLAACAVEVVVAIGGGSVLDTAKAFAAQRSAPDGWLSAHLREGAPFPADFRPPPILAVPTTAGTGSEVTMWGTVWDEKTGRKYSISHPRLYPEAALVDPTLTHTLPPATTVATALDALSHAMEAIWNKGSNPVSDGLALRAIEVVPDALPRVLAQPADAAAREALAGAALLAGLASSNTRTALAHSISYPLTSELGVPHGLACSLTLPAILERVDDEKPARAALIARAIGQPTPRAAAEALRSTFRAAGVGEELRRRIAGVDALAGLRGSLIAPGRAENCLIAADAPAAAEILRRSYEALCA